MKAVKVEYTVKDEFIEQNKKNIQAVMDAIQKNPILGMYYVTCQLEDKNSFMHINIAKDEETLQKLGKVEAFTDFRKALKESQPIQSPSQEQLTLVGTSWEI